MELHSLRCFLAVAEELNFGRAAMRLHITQPGLSQRIKALERSLGVQLFDRNRQKVALTPVGEGLLPEVKRLLTQADRVRSLCDYLTRQECAVLALGHTRSAGIGLAHALTAAFRRDHPEIELHTSMGFTAANMASVGTGELDVAFVRPEGSLPEDVALMTIGHDPIMVALPAGHRLLPADEIEVRDIVDEPLVFFPRDTAPGMWQGILHAVYGPNRTPPISRLEPEEQLMLAAVADRAGISLVTRPVAAVLEVPGVVIKPLRPKLAVPLGIIWLRDNTNPSVTAFLACARDLAKGAA
jgi:DNA-binding transcriptional LysR family regulator